MGARMRWFGLLVLGACKAPALVPPEGDTDTDTDSDTDTDTDTDSDTDTDADTDSDTDADTDLVPVITGAEGSVALFHYVPSRVLGPQEATLGLALFAEDLQGIENAAACFPAVYSACVDQRLPDQDTFVDLTATYEPDPDHAVDVGDVVLLGSIALQHEYDGVLGTWYRTQLATTAPLEQELGITFADGQFGVWFGADELAMPAAVQLIEPDPVGTAAWLEDGGTLPLSWVPDPTGQSQVELVLYDRREPESNRLRRLYVLEDDGSFVLDVDSLGLAPANRELTVSFARTITRTRDLNGNQVHFTGRSEARLTFLHPDLAGRTQVLGADTCGAATALEPGRYYGVLTGLTDTFDPSPGGCTGTDTDGRDALHRIELQPGERVTLRAELFDEDVAVYLLPDCADPESCVAGSDYGAGSDPERLRYTNQGDEPLTLWLAIDSDGAPDAELYLIDVAIDVPAEALQLPDRCQDAQTEPAITETTVLTVDLQGAIDHLSPLANGCSQRTAPGPDVMVPVSIPAGESLRVRSEAPLVTYLLRSCLDETTCEAGASPYQDLFFENLTAQPFDGFLVIDDPGEPGAQGPTEVELLFTSVEVLFPADTCADLPSAPVLDTGTWLFRGTLEGFQDDLDLASPGPSCTGFESSGADGMLQIQLEPGQALVAEYTQDQPGDGVLYLLERCDLTPTAVACDDEVDGGEAIRFVNQGASTELYTLVLDNWSNSAWAPPSGSFSLSVEIR